MVKRTHKLSMDQKNEIEKMFLEGNKTYIEIAKKYDVTPAAIRFLMTKKGHKSPYRKKIPPEIRQEIVEKYKTGEYLFKELAKEYKVSAESMRYMLNRKGCHAPSPTEISTKYKLDADYFQNIDCPDKAYFLGLLYADGCVYPPDRKMTISLQQGDRAILDNMREKIGSNKPLYFRPPYSKKNKKGVTINSHGHYVLTVVNEKMVNDLISHGVTPRKSKNLKFPNLPNDLIVHFIRGFFDGDGGVTLSRNDAKCSVSFMANIEFLYVLRDYMIRFIDVGQNKKFIKHDTCDIHYIFIHKRAEIQSIYNWFYDHENEVSYIFRKKDKLSRFLYPNKVI
jgi:transposase-like protein